MKKALLAVIITTAMLSGCGDDGTGPAPNPSPAFEDLTQRTHVLNNFELAYNKRNINQYYQLLDHNFIFFFSGEDVGGGLPVSWGRADELLVTTAMFDPNYSGSNRCKSISMDVAFEDGVQWQAVIPASAPDETWYETTVFYDFKFDTEPNSTWIAVPGAKARFVVRNDGTEDAPSWQLVELHDLGSVGLLSAPALGQSSTLGGIKALYR